MARIKMVYPLLKSLKLEKLSNKETRIMAEKGRCTNLKTLILPAGCIIAIDLFLLLNMYRESEESSRSTTEVEGTEGGDL
ncbi:hypothetical protein L2E82_35168 [Cichorium intybus]|uniref:Uncharacterized protein n=1 Tax=Cichorium intybus TaxID=13427 RepID=A0ACB9BNC8_CICIN|nr:hypothetical protein L2E82_35168 [Cichorium intybus]